MTINTASQFKHYSKLNDNLNIISCYHTRSHINLNVKMLKCEVVCYFKMKTILNDKSSNGSQNECEDVCIF